MKTIVPEQKMHSVLVSLMLFFLIPVMGSCQNNQVNQPNQSNQTTGQKPQEKPQAITPEQTAMIKTILSKYDASKLTAADAKAIHEKFRDAGIHAGPETRDAIVAAGFDPEKLRALDPPTDPGNQGKPPAPSNTERLQTFQEKVVKPLGLNTTQNEAVTKAYTDFFTSVESLKKSQSNSQAPLDKTKIEPLEKSRDEKISKVLSKEQFVKYQELEKTSRPPKPNGVEPKKN